MLDSFNIASTGLSAQRLRMDVIANNIANANTTRTPEGGAYQRKMVIFRTYDEQPQFLSPFTPPGFEQSSGKGVKVVKIESDSSPFRLVWDPNHPDAIQSGPKKGYVLMPNVNIVKEMTDLISASRSYEANSVVITNAKQLYMRSIDMLK
ncbi:MAG: flagellar basal body rod protein FlgC [Spirochaetes bacterium]|jgi:flagellar basal-body rod protein FlgC|nr:flagellar basal body rod protein FlgC [Spirochaetota bacterium]NLJ04615.1 flagellar basal body rod protein FlgC [Exilispira sp.]MBP8990706.1 flagellar basal body rod protein FlgC [Spirochaetota bacterium]HOV45733.1 flagellar basal body rod protein FlgC [Exilispira sp.]HPB47185.1 flagellar basal body rod protein FlgC [Exilispira sp.]